MTINKSCFQYYIKSICHNQIGHYMMPLNTSSPHGWKCTLISHCKTLRIKLQKLSTTWYISMTCIWMNPNVHRLRSKVRVNVGRKNANWMLPWASMKCSWRTGQESCWIAHTYKENLLWNSKTFFRLCENLTKYTTTHLKKKSQETTRLSSGVTE